MLPFFGESSCLSTGGASSPAAGPVAGVCGGAAVALVTPPKLNPPKGFGCSEAAACDGTAVVGVDDVLKALPRLNPPLKGIGFSAAAASWLSGFEPKLNGLEDCTGAGAVTDDVVFGDVGVVGSASVFIVISSLVILFWPFVVEADEAVAVAVVDEEVKESVANGFPLGMAVTGAGA